MKEYIVDTEESYRELKEYLIQDKPDYKIVGNNIVTQDFEVEVRKDFQNLFDEIRLLNNPQNALIYGKDPTTEITSIEVCENDLIIYKNNGNKEERKLKLWIVCRNKLGPKWNKLQGNNYYRYIRYCDTVTEFQTLKQNLMKKKKDFFTINNLPENQMIIHGLTYFKDLKVQEVSRLGFDIEADGLVESSESTIYTIANTYRDKLGTNKTVFRQDEYDSVGTMIEAWCEWVREKDPSVIVAHNGFGYDLRYLSHVANLEGVKLKLGKNGSEAKFPKYKKTLRVDGSQTWEYTNCLIHGRSIVDTMQLAVKYDIGRNFPSWGLKPIIEHLGMVEEGRQFYDASKIRDNWNDLVEREKIVQYCEDDGDDCLNLYELMVPSFFYMCQSIPKPFQVMLQGASGSWLNTILMRGYLQENKAIPKASDEEFVGGGMSYGIPGVYRNVTKWDAKSYYPSTILAHNINDPVKDPEGYYIQMVKHFTEKRFKQKAKYNETGDKYYDDLQASSKVFINSAYGLLGTSGLNFNNYKNAALITRLCRKGLQKCIIWATGKDYLHWWKPDDTLYKWIEVSYEDFQKTYEKYEGKCLVEKDVDKIRMYVPKTKTKESWKVSYCHSKTGLDDFKDFKKIDKIAKWSIEEMPRHDWILVNIDTDALSFAKKDLSPYTEQELNQIREEINNIMYSEWEDDGYYDHFTVLKAKNYVMKEKGSNKCKKKGSSLTDSKKEPALLDMLDEMIEVLLE